MKNQKGITLIALVVTIVVLLILAGTSIAMLTGDNGIITNAQKSQASNTEGEVIDKMSLAYNTAYTEARIKMSTDNGYQPSATTHVAELALIVAKELGLTSATDSTTAGIPATSADSVTDGYHVYYSTTTGKIVMVYGDSKFALNSEKSAGENNLYPAVRGEITLTTTGISYTAQPERKVK